MLPKSFGKTPVGKGLKRLQESKNYREGSFQNLVNTPTLAEGTSYFNLLTDYLKKHPDREPIAPLPAQKTDLRSIGGDAPAVVWFGHSSYFIQLYGKRILVDPVFSQRASPFQSIGGKSYPTATSYSVEDFPDIDILIITHDHYDHLDFNTIKQLIPKVRSVYTSLGVGSHLSYWGIEESRITELDWWDGIALFPGMDLIATPSRHFSGRLFTRGKTLWSSFVLRTPDCRIFLGGDSGYDSSFKEIGKAYGPFDLAVLECGQYNAMWPNIHMMPEETVAASIDLGAKALIPVHWGKFTLALHPWYEPAARVARESDRKGTTLATPLIGEPVRLGELLPQVRWWDRS